MKDIKDIYLDSYLELTKDEDYESSLLANTTAFLNEILEDINWVGFYLFKDNKLILNSFQGKVACSVINLDKGVCGYSFTNNLTTVVENVHEFKGHIACDVNSNSEIVIPININNSRYGVLDIDSPNLNRFSLSDKLFLESIVEILEKRLELIRIDY